MHGTHQNHSAWHTDTTHSHDQVGMMLHEKRMHNNLFTVTRQPVTSHAFQLNLVEKSVL